jgi:hypothetical protein
METHATDAPVPDPFPTPGVEWIRMNVVLKKGGSPARTSTRFAAVVDMVGDFRWVFQVTHGLICLSDDAMVFVTKKSRMRQQARVYICLLPT